CESARFVPPHPGPLPQERAGVRGNGAHESTAAQNIEMRPARFPFRDFSGCLSRFCVSGLNVGCWNFLHTMTSSKRKDGLLQGARVYLSGPMDFVASRAAEKQ